MAREFFPPDFFRRMDEAPDREFYREPRFEVLQVIEADERRRLSRSARPA
jgi:hypothetical protein